MSAYETAPEVRVGSEMASFDVRAQTVVQAGTAAISVVALVFSILAFQSQSDANDVQLRNDELKYASRVAWYIGSNGTPIIQNLSIVPVGKVELLAYDENNEATFRNSIGAIPPCVLVNVEDINPFNQYNRPDYRTLIFQDVKGYWVMGPGGPPFPISAVEYLQYLRPFRVGDISQEELDNLSESWDAVTLEPTTPAADCGVG